jgi:hypothetical protein
MRARPAVALLATLGAVVAALAGSPSMRLPSSPASQGRASASESQPQVAAAFGRLPLHFEANVGQAEPGVRFLSRGSGYALSLAADEAVLSLSGGSTRRAGEAAARGRSSRSSVLRTRLVGANPDPKVHGERQMPGRVNYFLGNDPRKWRRNVPLYARVAYEDVYPGIDLVYYGNQRELEYDFVVAPGADPRSIRMRFEGAESLGLDDAGDLRIRLEHGEVVHHAPRIRQSNSQGQEEPVGGQWSVSGLEAAFELTPYDTSRELVIDPVLEYSTFLGGTAGYDEASGIAVDGAGAAYVTGTTPSSDYPTKNPFQGMLASGLDAFVTKLATGGDSLVYSTFLGGSDDDRALGLAIDNLGDAYLAGYTASADFPTRGPLQTNQPGPDAFVAKLTATGDQLAYSTYLGGSGDEWAQGIAIDLSGSAYVTGLTTSADFPAVNARQGYAGETDAFVTKISATGAAIEYSTLVGGQEGDEAWAIAVDEVGFAFIAGTTASPDFPTRRPFQSTRQGFRDAFIAKMTPAGNDLVYSTYLGGTIQQEARGVAVDGRGALYVTGYTGSLDFPTRNAVQGAMAGYVDAFVSKLSAAGDALEYSTYLGGSEREIGLAIVVDAIGQAHLTGTTQSPEFPVHDPYQTYQGAMDVFVAKISSTGDRLLYSTFLGGPLPEVGTAIALDGAGSAYVAGLAYEGFPTVRPYQHHQGYSDAFVTKVGPPPSTSFWTLIPCRVVDTRNAAGPLGGPALVAGASRVLPIAGTCGIPPTARAVALNITAVQPTTAGHFRVNPSGGGLPPASALNYSAGQTRAGNGVFMVGSDGAITVRCSQSSGTVHLVVDVSGYFE